MKRSNEARHDAIQQALRIEGWMDRCELEQLYDWAGEMDSIVEIGSWKGRSTFALRSGTDGTVEAVDTFRGSANDAEHRRLVQAAGGSTLAEFIANTTPAGHITVTVKDSVEAAAGHPVVDMVFIDGGHQPHEVRADLRAWLPKARKLICGHDGFTPQVARAVREVLGPDVVVGTCGSLWYLRLEGKERAPLFSVLHASARPGQWRAVYDEWMRKAAHPEDVEYVLCVDTRWGFPNDPAAYKALPENIRVQLNNQRRCYVDGVNIAARASAGSILIVNADDQFSCDQWDEEILRVLSSAPRRPGVQAGIQDAWVLEVSTGTPNEHERRIMVMPILSRARYQAQGFVFYPEYESMFADNDFCESANRDGVVLDGRELMFPHRHPWFTPNVPFDPAYQAQNDAKAFRLGKAIFDKRQSMGFAVPQSASMEHRLLALCLSGEQFQGAWLDEILNLQAHLISRGFSIARLRAENNIVHLTRDDTQRAIMGMETDPDLILWLDDDNLLSPAKFDQLLATLDAHPEVDGVSGWCWIHNKKKQGFMVSCGEWAPDHLHWNPFPPSFQHEQLPRPFETGGLPCILMRYSALEKAGEGAFLPILDNRLEQGMSGEDMAFFWNAEKGGATFLVDPRVRVPHLKNGIELEPVFPEEGKVPVKVACMIRAKNEGRWIGRVIDSVKPLCGSLVYVMEDGSVDDTAELAREHGAAVLHSPFARETFNEVRDKDWLLQQVTKDCSPDWILMIDGDEELEPGGCEKIRSVLEGNPPIDCFALRVLYLWDSVAKVRLDGVYEKMARQSLFRANVGLSFRSYYEGERANTNHCGLHCSNAPDLGGAQGGGMRLSPLNVFLLHYGYLHRPDRIRKFEWITKLDPDNKAEDYYRHMVQGDIPEVPKGAKLKHGGPLLLSDLPARLVPKFPEGVPGPWAWRGPWPTGHSLPAVESVSAD